MPVYVVDEHVEKRRPTDGRGPTKIAAGGPKVDPRPVCAELQLDVHPAGGAGRTYPVEVYDDRGEVVPGFHGLAITGRCGPIDDELSPVMVVPPPVPEGEALPHRIGLRFWPDTWDGSDLFCPDDGSAWTLLAQDVRDALLAAKVTGIELDKISEIEQLLLESH
jgi:hypothetical protein